MSSKQRKQEKVRPLKRVLVANRGEIAVRIIRALRELAIESVALYTTPDRQSLHVGLADYAVCMEGSSLADTYLHHQKVIQAARLSGCDGIHPGYGFLSENTDFVRLVEASGNLRFIGPSSGAMAQLGDKVKAKQLLGGLNIPILPGSTTCLSSFAELEEVAEAVGYPLVLKAAAGGGGRGMRVVHASEGLRSAYEEAAREATNFFGVGDIFCEKFLVKPRHIEIQTIFDSYGGGVHLFERDCSLQRRYQKIVEEAPSVYLTDDQRKQMGQMALKAGLSAGYCGVATVEFICDKAGFYFMEMNTRIQVEHPVTEMITGVDLVKESIKMAESRKLSYQQADLAIRGHAIEVRINAEDPLMGFTPSFGKIIELSWPMGPGTRVDTHLQPGYEVPDLYDSLLAKVLVWGKDRAEAMARMERALRETVIYPLPTTLAFHEAVLRHPDFIAGDFSIAFLAENDAYFQTALCAQHAQNSGKVPSVNAVDDVKNQSDADEEVKTVSALLAEKRFDQLTTERALSLGDRQMWQRKARSRDTRYSRDRESAGGCGRTWAGGFTE